MTDVADLTEGDQHDEAGGPRQNEAEDSRLTG